MLAAWPMLVALGLGFFLIGTVVGSFLNVCIYRIPWQKSVIWPSSRCPRCWSAIAPQDNIPIVSWLALRGECRHCGSGISVRYPLVEALVGLLFLGAFLVDVVAAPRGPWWVIPTAAVDRRGLPCDLPVAPGGGDVHRLRRAGDPRWDHGDGDGHRAAHGDDLARYPAGSVGRGRPICRASSRVSWAWSSARG